MRHAREPSCSAGNEYHYLWSACAGPAGAHEWGRLVAAGRQLIDTAVFHAAHIQGLVELVTQSPATAAGTAPRAEDPQQEDEEESAEAAAPSAEGQGQLRSYLLVLFKVCPLGATAQLRCTA